MLNHLQGTDCDLVTGEEKKIVKGDEASAHCSSTVEMVSLTQHCKQFTSSI